MQDAGSKPAIFCDELCMKFREQRFGLECIKDTYSPNRKERVNNQGYHKDDRCRNKKWDTLMENWNMLASNMIMPYTRNDMAPVVQKLDSAIHRINHYALDSTFGFPNTYPLDRDLSGGWRYPTFEQLGPAV